MNAARKRKNKAFYIQANSKKKRYGEAKSLDNGMKGFLITTNGNEGKAVSEAYSLLNEYADVVYGPPSEQAHGEEELEGAVDVADALEEELAVLKQTTSSKGSHHRFKSVSSGARGVLFIKCSPAIEPHGVVNSMFNDILQQHKRKARFCVRFLPVDLVCPAFLDDIKRHIPSALKEFHDPAAGAMKFGVAIKCRNNSSVVKEEVVSAVADAVTECGKLPHKVDLSSPDRMVIVEIIQSHCCVSVVKDYYQFRKYNLQEAMSAGVSAGQTPTAAPREFPTPEEQPEGTEGAPTVTQSDPLTQEEPSTTQGGEPSTTQGKEPSTTQGGEPSTTQGKEPSTTQGGEPSTTQRGEPSTTQEGEPSTTQGEEPSTTQGEPSMAQGEPSMTESDPSLTQSDTSTTQNEPSLMEPSTMCQESQNVGQTAEADTMASTE